MGKEKKKFQKALQEDFGAYRLKPIQNVSK